MTILEHIHTLLDEDKDAIVSSYLSLLALIKTYQKVDTDTNEALNNIYNSLERHLEKLPDASVHIYEELLHNELARLEEKNKHK